MTNDQKDDYCKKYGIDDKSTSNSGPAPAPAPASAPKYVYYQNKCTKLKSAEDCKSIKYDDIFYKKPDESTQNTSCRKLNTDEMKIECLKPENNSIWIESANKCFPKLSKPELKFLSSEKHVAYFDLVITPKISLASYDLKYKLDTLGKIKEKFKSIRSTNTRTEGDNVIFNFKLKNLKSDTIFKLQSKIVNTNYPNINSEYSNLLNSKRM